MSDYRPICDVWILGRPRVAYYGAYPGGFLDRARSLIGATIDEPVLHVCGGKVRDYPFPGFGSRDKTLDLDPALSPDFCRDARDPLPLDAGSPWAGVLIDRPYTPDDAAHYRPGPDVLPSVNTLLKNALAVVRPGGCVGVLDYLVPKPPQTSKFIALVGVSCGFNNRIRSFSVFRREQEKLGDLSLFTDVLEGP